MLNIRKHIHFFKKSSIRVIINLLTPIYSKDDAARTKIVLILYIKDSVHINKNIGKINFKTYIKNWLHNRNIVKNVAKEINNNTS